MILLFTLISLPVGLFAADQETNGAQFERQEYHSTLSRGTAKKPSPLAYVAYFGGEEPRFEIKGDEKGWFEIANLKKKKKHGMVQTVFSIMGKNGSEYDGNDHSFTITATEGNQVITSIFNVQIIDENGVTFDGPLVIPRNVSKGEQLVDFSISVHTNDPNLSCFSIDREDVFSVHPKCVSIGEKAFLTILEPRFLAHISVLPVNVTTRIGDNFVSLPILFNVIGEQNRLLKPIQFFVEEDANEQPIGELLPGMDGLTGIDHLPFTLNGSQLWLSCSGCLDFENISVYEMFGQINGSIVPVLVHVIDVNDNAPTIESSVDVIRVSSNRLLHPLVLRVEDKDSVGENSLSIGGNASEFFAIRDLRRNVFELILRGSSQEGTYSLILTVFDDKEHSRSKTVTVLVHNSRIHFRRTSYKRVLAAQNMQKGNAIVHVELEGKPIDEVIFIALKGNPGWVSVDEYGGKVNVGDVPRRGIPPGHYSIVVAAVEKETFEVISETTLTITVTGATPSQQHNYTPQTLSFNKPKDDSRVFLDLPSFVGNNISYITALDNEAVRVVSTDEWELIDGRLKGRPSEHVQLISFQMQSNVLVVVYFVSDVEEEEQKKREKRRPLFPFPFSTHNNTLQVVLREETPQGTTVAVLPATDPSTGQLVRTQIRGHMAHLFSIHTNTGAIRVASNLDYEVLGNEERSFTIQLSSGDSEYDNHIDITVEILDIPDSPPQFPSNLRQVTVVVMENVVDSIVARFPPMSASNFSLLGISKENFQVVQTDNEVYVAVKGALEREQRANHFVQLLATDNSGFSDHVNLHVLVNDVNDIAPEFDENEFTLRVLSDCPVGMIIGKVHAIDRDALQNGRVTFSIDPNHHIAINATTGEMIVARDLLDVSEIRLNVTATDAGIPPLSSRVPVSIHVFPPNLAQSIHITNIPPSHLIHVPLSHPSSIFHVHASSDDVFFDIKPATPSDAGWIDMDADGNVFAMRNLSSTLRHLSMVVFVRKDSEHKDRPIDSALLRIEVERAEKGIRGKEGKRKEKPTQKEGKGGHIREIREDIIRDKEAIIVDESSLGRQSLPDPPLSPSSFSIASSSFSPSPSIGSSSNMHVHTNVSDIIRVDSDTGSLRIDPMIFEHQHGIYSLNISMKKDGTTMEFPREVHFVPSTDKMRLLFAMNVGHLGRNVQSLVKRLNEVLGGSYHVFMDEPSPAENRRSSVCIHITKNGEVLPRHSVSSLLAKSEVSTIYHVYKVIGVEGCDAVRVAVDGVHSSVLIFACLVLLLVFTLTSLVCYICFVVNYRSYL